MLYTPEGWSAPIVPTKPGAYAIFGEDSQLSVCFKKMRIPNEFKTKQTQAEDPDGIGYMVFDEVDSIHIRGIDKFTSYWQPVRPQDIARFPRHWEEYKSGKAVFHGVPIQEWDYKLSDADLYTLRVLGIDFVHQIAGMTDSQKRSLGLNGDRLVARAKVAMSDMATKEANSELQMQLDAIKKAREADQEELAQIKRMLGAKSYESQKEEREEGRRMQELAEKPKRKPGRPRQDH